MKIITFSGSGRSGSLNTLLVKLAEKHLASYGVEPIHIDIKSLNLPLYDGDVEQSAFPGSIIELKPVFENATGFLVSCPEYNSSFSPLLKNFVDWLSRPTKGDAGSLSAFRNKVVAISCASMGGFAGIRNLNQMRNLFSNIGSVVVPNQFGLAKAHEAFNQDGTLKDESNTNNFQNFVKEYVEYAKKLL